MEVGVGVGVGVSSTAADVLGESDWSGVTVAATVDLPELAVLSSSAGKVGSLLSPEHAARVRAMLVTKRTLVNFMVFLSIGDCRWVVTVRLGAWI